MLTGQQLSVKFQVVNIEIGYAPELHMSDYMRTQLTDFAADFMAEAQAEQRLKEVFEKHMETARAAKNAGNCEQLVESYIRASSAATFLELISSCKDIISNPIAHLLLQHTYIRLGIRIV